jgi:Trypsin-co-occurring domain 2
MKTRRRKSDSSKRSRRTAGATGGIRFWVIELGGKASHESESVHTVTVSLGAPVDSQGKTIKVVRTVSYKP